MLGTLPVIRRTPSAGQTPHHRVAPPSSSRRSRPSSSSPASPWRWRSSSSAPWARPCTRHEAPSGFSSGSPRELLGRTTAVERFAGYLGMLLGAIAAVSLVQPLGWEATVLIVCAVGATLLFVTAVSEGGSRSLTALQAMSGFRVGTQRVVQIRRTVVNSAQARRADPTVISHPLKASPGSRCSVLVPAVSMEAEMTSGAAWGAEPQPLNPERARDL